MNGVAEFSCLFCYFFFWWYEDVYNPMIPFPGSESGFIRASSVERMGVRRHKRDFGWLCGIAREKSSASCHFGKIWKTLMIGYIELAR